MELSVIERENQLRQALKRILERLVAQYDPEKVFLFGSAAAGEVREWSDLDLVIVARLQKPFMKRLIEVALLCDAQVPVDYLVYTPEEFASMVAEGNPFIVQEVLEKGQVLYDRERGSALA